jgi:hypothetical protein
MNGTSGLIDTFRDRATLSGVVNPLKALTGAGRSGNVNPAGSCVERARRGAVERDRGIGSVSPHKIEHLLEQLKLVPYTAADDNALPWPDTQGSGDDRRHVVAPVEAE